MLAVAIEGVVAEVGRRAVKRAGDLDGGRRESVIAVTSVIAAPAGFWLVVHLDLADGHDAKHAGVRKTLQPPLAPDADDLQPFGLFCR